jgi:hypothetical protein
MSAQNSSVGGKSRGLSADTWAVLLALAAAVLVKLTVIKTVPW